MRPAKDEMVKREKNEEMEKLDTIDYALIEKWKKEDVLEITYTPPPNVKKRTKKKSGSKKK